MPDPPAAAQHLTYTYDPGGNVLSMADAASGGQVQTFAYDELNRLTSASTSAAGQGLYGVTYTYNEIGNLTGATWSSGGNGQASGTYTYPAAGQPRPHAVTATAFSTMPW